MSPHTERLHALDAVRAFALLSGIALHAALPWLANLPDWEFDETPSAMAAGIWYFVHIFRMPVFFLIAGFFGRLVTERRGTKAFIKDRAKRIALPFSVGCFVIPVLTVLLFALGSLASGMSLADLSALAQDQRERQSEAVDRGAGSGSLGHLWFLYYLLIFYAGTLVLRVAVRAVERDENVHARIDAAVRFLMRTGLAAFALGVPIAAWYVLMWPEWPAWTGFPSPTSLSPNVPALLGYGFFFGLGWLLHRQTGLLLQLRDRWVVYLLVAIALLR